jgi:hypothetical protein
MTLDVYAQLEQRVDRQHGTSFDLLIRRAREELRGVAQSLDGGSPTPEEAPSWSSVGHGPEDATAAAGVEGAGSGREPHQEADSEMARARIELATPRFSVVTGVAGRLRLVRFPLQSRHFARWPGIEDDDWLFDPSRVTHSVVLNEPVRPSFPLRDWRTVNSARLAGSSAGRLTTGFVSYRSATAPPVDAVTARWAISSPVSARAARAQ